VALHLRLLLPAAALCLACASIEPNPVDLAPVARLGVPAAGELARRFPDFEQIVSYGKHVRTHNRAGAGPLEWVSGSLTYVPNGEGDSHGGAKSWVVEVDLVTFRSSAEAESFRKDRCWMMAHEYQKAAEDARVEESDASGLAACKAPIMQLKKDEYDLPLEVPTSSYLSGAVVRNDRLVIHLSERREGGGRGTALDWALALVSKRLSS